MIVLLGKMTEPHLLQLFGCIIGKCLTAILIRQMTAVAGYPLLQILRIIANTQHFLIIVSLKY